MTQSTVLRALPMRRLLWFVLLLPVVAGCSPQPGLRVGNSARPLAGTDVEGRPISLAEFRGRVVVVDFWATWCKYCVEMIPHEKQLVKRMAGRPFVLLGVSADSTPEKLRSFLQRQQIPWPNIYDGNNGPLCASWEIEGFPAIFVIDAEGVIRFRDLRGAELDEAVEKLVREAENKK